MLTDGDGAAAGVRVEVTRLEAGPDGAAVAVGTGTYEEHEAQLVLESIGYRSLALEGAPFDARAGVIPNAAGRVLKGARLKRSSGWFGRVWFSTCWYCLSTKGLAPLTPPPPPKQTHRARRRGL